MQNLLNLLAFVRVVEAGSFAEAARRAGTTTSAMSKAVLRFEQAHSVKLLHRTTHALSATVEGERLLDGARDLLRDAERLEASLAEASGRSAIGRVRISAPGAFARACLLPILPRLMHEHPGIDVEVSFDDALVELGAEGFDFALRTGQLEGQPGLLARSLMTYPMLLCAAPDYFARRGTPVSVADLATHELIGFRSRTTGILMPWIFTMPDGSAVRHVPRARLVVDDGTAGWAMIRDGLGLSWAPAWLGLDDLRSGRVVEAMRPARIAETQMSAIRLDRRHTPLRTQTVLDYIAAEAMHWRI
jgi:DNA-binding transcriptional LysR family regulator